MEYHHTPPVLPWTRDNCQTNWRFFLRTSWFRGRQKVRGTVSVCRRRPDMRHCRWTQLVLKRRVPHPSHLTGPLIWVELTKYKNIVFLMCIPYERQDTVHPILSYPSFIRWSPSLKCPASRMFTPHRRRLFPYMHLLSNLSDQRWWKEFWRWGHHQMVENMYRYFDSNLSESHRDKMYIWALVDPRFKNYNMWSTRKYVKNAQLCTKCI
jgi:hypothetical protein